MNLRSPLFTAIVVIIMSFSVALMSQGLTDGIKVTLPEAVTVGDQVLEPGEYEIRRASTAQDQVLQIFSNDKMRWQTAVLTIPTVGEQTPEESKVVLHHIGDNFYFDKIWIEGKTYGYEFPLPDKAKALQRELALTVPAKYEPTQSSAQAVQPNSQEVERAGSQVQVDSAAQERERQAALEQERRNAAEREQQAQADRERIASLQRDQSVTPAPTPDSRATQTPANVQRDTQSNAQTPGQLPATASNWIGFLVGGMLLLTMSALLRPTASRQRQEK